MKAYPLLLAALVIPSLAMGCKRPTPDPPSTARALPIFSPDLPDDSMEQARKALEEDAYRREGRFLDALSPGAAMAATRVEQREIDRGAWTSGDLYRLGGQLFHLTFTAKDGYGGKDLPHLARFHKGRRGGPDAMVCASCHWRGGPAGAGDAADDAYLDGDGDHQSSALARNPKGLSGAGVVELLAREMTRDLLRQRDDLVKAAKARGKSLRVDLVSKGVSFGKLGALPDGQLDASELAGVDADLSVKPFGWKGTFASLRDAVEDELLTHHGMESEHLVHTAPPERIGPFGGEDPDGDGVTREITEGQVTALTVYLAMQEIPRVEMPTRQDMLGAWSKGQAIFQTIGCARCHVPEMRLDRAIYDLAPRAGGAPLAIDLASAGAAPRLGDPAPDGGTRVWLFSDLRRHDMGPRLAEPRPDRGVPGAEVMTPPLWALARTRPYLHDGSAPTVEDAILAHGGDAQPARDAFAALDDQGRYPLRLYLATLTRAPRMVAP